VHLPARHSSARDGRRRRSPDGLLLRSDAGAQYPRHLLADRQPAPSIVSELRSAFVLSESTAEVSFYGAVPKVRIPLPPAGSLVRTWLSGAVRETGGGLRAGKIAGRPRSPAGSCDRQAIWARGRHGAEGLRCRRGAPSESTGHWDRRYFVGRVRDLILAGKERQLVGDARRRCIKIGDGDAKQPSALGRGQERAYELDARLAQQIMPRDRRGKAAASGDLAEVRELHLDPTWTAGRDFAIENGRNAGG
jgi:hypothetical protein